MQISVRLIGRPRAIAIKVIALVRDEKRRGRQKNIRKFRGIKGLIPFP